MAGENRRRRLRALLSRAGVQDSDVDAIDRAFVHGSAATERGVHSNERLEFLGDAVLGLIVAWWLYDRYPGTEEGILARRKAAIVSDSAIAQTAKRIGFSDLIEVGAGERAHGGAHRDSTLGDAFEAFVGAVFLEHGLDAARRFVLQEHVPSVDVEQAGFGDAKTQLQELTQSKMSCVPEYSESAEGPHHSRTFTSVVQVGGEVLGTGTGPSKKSAQQQAAAAALDALQKRFGLTNATQEN